MSLIHMITSVIMGILGVGFNLALLIIKVIIAFIVGGIASAKGRSGLFYGVLAYFFPWMIFIIPFIPRKVPKLPVEIRNHPAFQNKNPVIASIMALSASVAKADGAVTREEIQYIKQFIITHFNISKEALNGYAEAFDYGKNNPTHYAIFTQVLRMYYQNRQTMMTLAYLFLSIAMENGQITDEEDRQLSAIVQGLGLSDYEYQSLKSAFSGRYNQQSYHQSYQQYGHQNKEINLVKKYCEVLGVNEEASLAEIKKAYRKLAKDYHPDKFSSENMPEHYMKFANEKIAELNEAYEYLKKAKESNRQ